MEPKRDERPSPAAQVNSSDVIINKQLKISQCSHVDLPTNLCFCKIAIFLANYHHTYGKRFNKIICLFAIIDEKSNYICTPNTE